MENMLKKFKAVGKGDTGLRPLKALPNHEPRHLPQNKYSMDDAIYTLLQRPRHKQNCPAAERAMLKGM